MKFAHQVALFQNYHPKSLKNYQIICIKFDSTKMVLPLNDRMTYQTYQIYQSLITQIIICQYHLSEGNMLYPKGEPPLPGRVLEPKFPNFLQLLGGIFGSRETKYHRKKTCFLFFLFFGCRCVRNRRGGNWFVCGCYVYDVYI